MTSHRGLLILAFLHEFWPCVNKLLTKSHPPKPFFSRDFAGKRHAVPRPSGTPTPPAPIRVRGDTITRKRLILVNLDHDFPVRADIAAIHARRVEGHSDVAVLVYGDH